MVERGHAVVVEARGDGAVDRHVLERGAEFFVAALDLLAHVAQGVERAPAVELVDRHQVGEVEHVDLLELAGGAELGRHDVERAIDVGDDPGVALADARGLDDDEIEAGRLAGGDDVRQVGGDLAIRIPGRQRAHEHLSTVDRVHADAVAEQGAAALALGRVDGDDRDARFRIVEAEAADQFVGQRRLAGAAGAGDAEHRDRPPVRSHLLEACAQGRIEHAPLQPGDDPRQNAPAVLAQAAAQTVKRGREILGEVEIGAGEHVVDHALKAHALAVVGRVDAGDAVVPQFADLLGHDDPAAAAEDPNIPRATLTQQVDHVLEELDVPALIGADGDTLHVLLDRGRDHLLDRAVVAQVNDLGARGLKDAADDVDRGVVAVEQARRGHEADLVLRCAGRVAGRARLADTLVGHACLPAFGAPRLALDPPGASGKLERRCRTYSR